MRLILFGKVNMDQKVKSPTRPNKKVPFLLWTIAMLLLPKPSPIGQKRGEYYPMIDQEKDGDDDNLRMPTENSAQVKEKQEDDLCCEHSIIVETRYDQMR